MPDTIDRMQVELDSNIQEFLSEIRVAEDATNDFEKELGQTERASNELADEMSQTARDAQDLGERVGDIADNLDEMADRANEAANETDDLGDKAKDSKGSLDNLNDVLGKFGVTLGISAVITAIMSIGEFAIESADKAAEAMETIAFKTGLAGEELEKYSDAVSSITSTTPYSQESVSDTMATLRSLNRDAEISTLENLTSQWQAFMAMNPEASVEDFDRVFKKWGVSVEEQAGYLSAFNKISQETNISMSALASALADGDRGYQMMGKNLIESAAYLGEANYSGELDDAIALANALEMVQAQKADLLGSDEEAAKYVAEVWDNAIALGDEGAIVKYLTETEGIGIRVAGTIAASMTSSADTTEKLVAKASTAMEDSLVELDNQIQTTGDKWSIIWNNMAIAMEPVGTGLSDILDSIADLTYRWNLSDDNKLEIVDDFLKGGVVGALTGMHIFTPAENLIGAVKNIPNVILNQTINSPTPLDGAKIRQETERGLKTTGKSLTTSY